MNIGLAPGCQKPNMMPVSSVLRGLSEVGRKWSLAAGSAGPLGSLALEIPLSRPGQFSLPDCLLPVLRASCHLSFCLGLRVCIANSFPHEAAAGVNSPL